MNKRTGVRFRRIVSKCLAVLCSVSILITSGAVPVSADDYTQEEAKSKIEQLNNRYVELENQKKAIASQLASVQSQKAQQSQAKNQLENQISATTEQINLLIEKIGVLEDEIAYQEEEIAINEQEIEAKEVEIAEKEAEIQANEELLKQRLRRSYMEGTPSALEVLLGSGSFFSMLSGTQMVSRIVDHDKQLLSDLADEKIALIEDEEWLSAILFENDQIRQELVDIKEQLEYAKTLQDEKAEELQGKVEEINSEIQSLSATEKEYYANQAKIQAEMKAAQDEITEIYKSLESVGEYTGGAFGWPVPGYSMITSYYGWRFNNTDYHTGIDISGANVYGKNVVAANPGRVAFINTKYTNGVGYGIYMIVDHGGGYSTLYAHLSSIDVQVGDVVARGTPIAKVGSTGWSTGPHLHFEVRINGQHQNPLNYLG